MQSEDFMTGDCWLTAIHAPKRNTGSGWLMKQLCNFQVRVSFRGSTKNLFLSRITNEVAGIKRATYDISSKPPAVCFSNNV